MNSTFSHSMHHSVSVVESKRLLVPTDPSDSELMHSFQINNDPPQSDAQSDLSLDYLKTLQCSACDERVPLGKLDIHWDTSHHSSIIPESKRYFVLGHPSDSDSVHLYDSGHVTVTPLPSASTEDHCLFNDDTTCTSVCGPDKLSQYAPEIVVSHLKIKLNQSGSSPLQFNALFEPNETDITESVNEFDFSVAETAMRPTMELPTSMLVFNPCSVPVKDGSRLLVPIATNIRTESMGISQNECKEERHCTEMCPAPLPSLRCIPRQNSVCNIDEIFDCQTTIGFGSSCTVMKAQNIENGKFVALKQIPKGRGKDGGITSEALLSNEKATLDALEQHENGVRLLGVYETPGHYFLATELLTGNELMVIAIHLDVSEHIKTSRSNP